MTPYNIIYVRKNVDFLFFYSAPHGMSSYSWNDKAQISRLRTAIRLLRGVEQVTMLREAKPMRSKAIAPQSIRRFKSAIAKAEETPLEGWILFPDARGYL